MTNSCFSRFLALMYFCDSKDHFKITMQIQFCSVQQKVKKLLYCKYLSKLELIQTPSSSTWQVEKKACLTVSLFIKYFWLESLRQKSIYQSWAQSTTFLKNDKEFGDRHCRSSVVDRTREVACWHILVDFKLVLIMS